LVGWFLLTVAVGFVGSWIGKALKIPAGAMLGAVIGSRISKRDVLGIKVVALPALVLILGMIVMNLMVGLAIHYLGGLDITTALFASAPGGLSDMTLIADELRANIDQVAVLQLVRFLTILLRFFSMLFL